MKIGISTNALSWAFGIKGYPKPYEVLTIPKLLKTISDQDVRLLQIDDNYPLHVLTVSELDNIRLIAKQYNIELEIGIRGADKDLLLKYIRIARLLGVKLIKTILTNKEISKSVKDIAELVPILESENITLAVENHGMHTSEELAEFFNKVNSPLVGACLDAVNSLSVPESPKEAIDKLSPYVVNLHVKDFYVKRKSNQMGFEVIGTAIGKGKLDLDYIIKTFDRLGVNPNALIELWVPFTDTIDKTVDIENIWLLESIETLKHKKGFKL